MMSPGLRVAAALVRAWTRLYTWRVPPTLRDERRAEIESDLWEFQHDPDVGQGFRSIAHLLSRLAIGMADDLSWRLDLAAVEQPAMRSFAVAATVTGPRRLSAFGVAAALHVLAAMMLMWLPSPEPHTAQLELRPSGRASVVQPSPRRTNRAPFTGYETRIAMHDAVESRWSMKRVVVNRFMAVVALAAGVMGASPAVAQPSFDVASVKSNDQGPGLSRFSYAAGGRVTIVNIPLRQIVLSAFRLQSFQLLNAPDWIDAPFDIVAKADGNPPVVEMQTMLQALLRDRFGLVTHVETRNLPVYALAVSRGDGRLGDSLRRSGTDCMPVTLPKLPGGAPPPPPPPPAGALPPPENGPADPNRLGGRCPSLLLPGYVSAREVTMTQFATILGRWVGRKVVDRTALDGTFDVDLKYQSDQPVAIGPGGVGITTDPTAPSIFTALQEQLGLRLEATKGAVEVLIIDRMQRPGPN